MTRARLLAAGLAVLTMVVVAACGGSSSQPKQQPAPKKKLSNQSVSAQLSAQGSGAVVGTSTVDDTAAVPQNTPPVDAIYGPPDAAVSSEDALDGDTGILADDGTISETSAENVSRERLGRNYSVPTDQNFTTEWFARNSPWNIDIANYPVDVRSSQMLKLAQERVNITVKDGTLSTHFVPDNQGLFINTVAWTTPVVQGGPVTAVHCRQSPDCGDDHKNRIKALQIPRSVNPNPYYDGWFTVISPNGHTAYDLWRARRLSDGSISFQYMRIWNLQGAGYGRPGDPSARGSGLPLFAGLIRPGELQSGQINHALAISVPAPAQRNYVQPASTTDGTGATNSLPEGARIRLKPGVRIPDTAGLTAAQRRYASALMSTLRNYGAIVVDRSAVPTLYGQQGVSAPLLSGDELRFLKLSDFQVVNLPPLHQYPSAKTRLTGAAADVSSVTSETGGGE